MQPQRRLRFDLSRNPPSVRGGGSLRDSSKELLRRTLCEIHDGVFPHQSRVLFFRHLENNEKRSKLQFLQLVIAVQLITFKLVAITNILATHFMFGFTQSDSVTFKPWPGGHSIVFLRKTVAHNASLPTDVYDCTSELLGQPDKLGE